VRRLSAAFGRLAAFERGDKSPHSKVTAQSRPQLAIGN
jgi:hypothetical protein